MLDGVSVPVSLAYILILALSKFHLPGTVLDVLCNYEYGPLDKVSAEMRPDRLFLQADKGQNEIVPQLEI